MDFAAKKIEQLKTADLVPYARNARTHSEEQVAQIAGSIREFGFTNPVLIDGERGIIAGHGRVLAAQSLGIESVPCIRLGHLTESQRRAYVLADNRLALNAGWDAEMLAVELDELKDAGVDLASLGFDKDELNELIGTPNTGPLPDPPIPPVPVTPKTVLGDVWLLGDHRLMCGDSTSAENVASLMGGGRVALCFTSPPYGQQRDYTTGGIGDWDILMRGVFANLPLSDDGQCLVNLGLIHRDGEVVSYWDGWIEFMKSIGMRRFGWYVWDQGSGLPGDWNGRLAPSHEFVFHFNRDGIRPEKFVEKKAENVGATGHGTGLRGKDGKTRGMSSPELCKQPNKIPDSVIRITRHMANDIARLNHPAVFPVDLPAFFMKCWPGDCYEPFSGSGTSIIAAENTGNRCFAMELAPQYVDVSIIRWQNHTGKKAVHAITGEEFNART